VLTRARFCSECPAQQHGGCLSQRQDVGPAWKPSGRHKQLPGRNLEKGACRSQVSFLDSDLERNGDATVVRGGQPDRPDPQAAEPPEVGEKGKIDESEEALTAHVAHKLDHREVKLGPSLEAAPAASAVRAEIPGALEGPRLFD